MATKRELIKAAQFADKANVTVSAVRKWEARGIGPRPVRPEGTRLVLYRLDEVEKWLSGEQMDAEEER